MTHGVMTPLTPLHPLQQHPRAGSQGVGIATLIFRYFLRYFSSTHRTDLSRFRGPFYSFDPVSFAIFAIPQAPVVASGPFCRNWARVSNIIQTRPHNRLRLSNTERFQSFLLTKGSDLRRGFACPSRLI